MLKKQPSIKIKKIATIIFLLPLFIYRLRSPLPYFMIGEVMTILEVVVLSVIGIRFSSYLTKIERVNLIVINILLLLHGFLALFWADYSIDFSVIFKIIRFTYYITLTYIFAKIFYDSNIFIKYFINFIIISLLPFFIFNDNFLSVQDYYANRFAGFYSEPSALSPFLTVLIVLAIIKKKYIYLLLLGFIFLKTDSGTSYLVLSFTLILLLFKLGKNTILKVSLFVAFISFFLLNRINLSALTSFNKIETILYMSDFSDGKFGQARIQNFYNSLAIMHSDNTYFIGYGTNTWEAITNKAQELRIFSLTHFILISFGFLTVPLFYLFLKKVIKNYKTLNILELTVMLSFLFASLLNSAQGAIVLKILFLFLFIKLNSGARLSNKYSKMI